MDAFEILVIILSSFLALAILVTIVTVIYILKVVKSIQRISAKAETVVESASNISKFMSPAVAGKYVFESVQKAVKNHKKGK